MFKLCRGHKSDFYNIFLAPSFIRQQSQLFLFFFFKNIYLFINIFFVPFLRSHSSASQSRHKWNKQTHRSKCRAQFYSKYFVTFEVNLSFKLSIFIAKQFECVSPHTDTHAHTYTKYSMQTTVVLFGQKQSKRQGQSHGANGRARGNRCVNDEFPR